MCKLCAFSAHINFFQLGKFKTSNIFFQSTTYSIIMNRNEKPVDLRFVPGSTHLMVGPTGSGKSFRTAEILRLKNQIIRGGQHIKNVVFCYSTWQPLYTQLEREGVVTKWLKKLPSNEEFVELVGDYKDQGGSIVIVDDHMGNIGPELVEIVTVTARHTNTSLFLLFQSLFPSNPLARQISLNVKYFHIHKNPRENAQLQYLARQLRPDDYKWIDKAYHKATEKPFSCFLIDLYQETKERLRFRSSFLPQEAPMKTWVSTSRPRI